MPGIIGLRGRDLARGLRPGLFLLLAVISGCASGGASDPFSETVNTDGFLLRVESRNTYEVEVYINPGGKRRLVGTVPANGLEFLEFEYPAGQPLYVELETRLGDRYRVPGVAFPGGGRVDMMISNTLRNSGFVRRAPSEPASPRWRALFRGLPLVSVELQVLILARVNEGVPLRRPLFHRRSKTAVRSGLEKVRVEPTSLPSILSWPAPVEVTPSRRVS